MTYFNGVAETVDEQLKPHRRAGAGPRPTPHFAAGWADRRRHAVPVRTKQVAVNFGGNAQRHGRSTGPRASRPRARSASQFHHVIDIAPTVLEAAGLPEPEDRSTASRRSPIEGVSLVYTFDDAKAKDRHTHAVFRDLRQPRHLPRRLVRRHPAQGALGGEAARRRSTKDIWELYNVARGLQPGQRPRRQESREARRRCRRSS